MVENHAFYDFFAPVRTERFVGNRIYGVAIPFDFVCGRSIVVHLLFVEGAIENAKRINKFACARANVYKMISVAVFTCHV